MDPMSSIPMTVYSLLAGASSEVTAHAYIITPGTSEYTLRLSDQNVRQSLSMYSGVNEGVNENSRTISCNTDISRDEQFVDSRPDINSFALDSQGFSAGISGEDAKAFGAAMGGLNSDAAITIGKNRKVFSMVQATLSADVVETLGSACLLETLNTVCATYHVQVSFNCDNGSYIAVSYQIDGICQLECLLVKLLSEIRPSSPVSEQPLALSSTSAAAECPLLKGLDEDVLPSSSVASADSPKKRCEGQQALPCSDYENADTLHTAANADSLQMCRAGLRDKHNVMTNSLSLQQSKCDQTKKRGRPRKNTSIIDGLASKQPAADSQETLQSVCSNDWISKSKLITIKRTTFAILEDPQMHEDIAPKDQDGDASGSSQFTNTSAAGVSSRTRLFSRMYELMTPYRYFCSQCSFRTKRMSHLRHHMTIHNRGVAVLKCHTCSFQTTRANHMSRHAIRHETSSLLSCSVRDCQYRTYSSDLLRRHMTSRHVRRRPDSNRVFACKVRGCSYRASTEYRARRHEARHRDVDIDGLSHSLTNTSTQLVERYCCQMCDYETPQRDLFRRHVQTVHGNQRPYLCDICGRRYKRSDALAQHLVVHTAQESRIYQHQCITCGRKFRSLSHLTEHMTTHNTARSFLCELCGAALKSRSAQRKHIQSIHIEPRSFACPSCDRRFNTSFAMKRHARLHDNQTTVGSQPASHKTRSSSSRRSTSKSTVESRTSQKLSELLSGIIAK